MKAIRLAAVAALLALLCGCSSQLEKEYSSITPHEEQYEVDQNSDALTAENYLGLKNAILSFVETGEDYGVIRIYSYEGNVVSDLANAVYEVSHSDPLGAYAVDYMTYDYAHIVSYYEIYLYINFRVDIDSIDSIIYCSSTAEVEPELERMLVERSYATAIRISNFQEFDPAELLHRLFLSHPELGISEPDCSYTFYPDSGIQRILELTITYPYDALNMLTRENTLAEVSTDIATMLAIQPEGAQRVEALYRWFADSVTYMGEDSALFASSYNALVNHYGSSLGIAMAVQLLCDQLDIPCFTVEGSYQESLWYWNMVYFDGIWHHMDVASGLAAGQEAYEPLYDEQMTAYSWNQSIYPACPLPDDEPEEPDTSDDPVEEPGDEPVEPIEPIAPVDPVVSDEPTIPDAPEETDPAETEPEVSDPSSEDPPDEAPSGEEASDEAISDEEASDEAPSDEPHPAP